MSESAYFAPESLKEAIFLLSQHRGNSTLVAGGTDLITRIKDKVLLPDCLINIGNIGDLRYIEADDKVGLRIGTLTTVASITKSSLIRSKYGILACAADSLANPTVRSRATVGGNLCNAAPSADTVPAFIVMGASVKIDSEAGERTVPVEDFFTGPGQTVLKNGEILVEVRIPEPPAASRGVYIKQKRRRGADLAVVGAATMVLIEDGILADVKIALGAVAPTPIRARKAEEILKGKKPEDGLFEEAGKLASGESSPIDDTRSSADYRRKMVGILVKRVLKEAIEQV